MDDKQVQVVNPVQQLMMNGMPGLPQIIASAMPPPMTPMSLDQGPIGMIFGNFKRQQLVKAAEAESKAAFYAQETVKAKLEAMYQIVTYSARINDGLGEYKHREVMRDLDEQRAKAEVTKIQYETAILANEVKLGELEYRIKEKQMKGILDGTSET